MAVKGSAVSPSFSRVSAPSVTWVGRRARIRFTRSEAVLRVIRAYDDRAVRYYCRGRFCILRQRFLDEIGQYLPATGRVLDIGCGFGLFSLYYGLIAPGLELRGLDFNLGRIAMARRAAARLGLRNVLYEVGDARDFRSGGLYDAAYMLDIIHHVEEESVRPLLEQLAKAIRSGGRLIIKDVDTRPVYKRWFTHALDGLMDPHSHVRYWPAEELQALIEAIGFTVHRHLIWWICSHTLTSSTSASALTDMAGPPGPFLRAEEIITGYGRMEILHPMQVSKKVLTLVMRRS